MRFHRHFLKHFAVLDAIFQNFLFVFAWFLDSARFKKMLAVRSGAHMVLVQRIVSSSVKVAASQALPAGNPSHSSRVHLQIPCWQVG